MLPILKYKKDDISRIFRRNTVEQDVENTVREILREVKEKGDAALFSYAKKFDRADLNAGNLLVQPEEIKAAYKKVDKNTVASLRAAKQNILSYNKKIKPKDKLFRASGAVTGYIVRPMDRVGLYVPGGKAAYPSSMLMCALPAVAAGVPEIIMTTPVGAAGEINPVTLVAADLCGIKKIFKIGGAQAVAAMAYGTESVPRVDLIAGPGNIYVATAKREVFGQTGIDSIAGPSEIVVIADDTASAEFVAADLLSQAEHDERAMAILITNSKLLAEKVNFALKQQITRLARFQIAMDSLINNGMIVLTNSIQEAIELSNQIAPEHLELCVERPAEKLFRVRNAGAVFLGHYAPEPLGDYMAGPNHVLPTNGTARFFSALSVETYMKKISYIEYTKSALYEVAEDTIRLAESEGLTAHANSIKVRF